MKKILSAIMLLSLSSCTVYEANYAAPKGPDERVNPYEVKPVPTEGTLTDAVRDVFIHR